MPTIPPVSRWLHERGFVAGDIAGQRNLLDVIKDNAFQWDLHTAMFGAAQADRPTYEKLLRGFATLGGVPWTKELQQTAASVSGDVAKIAPYVQRLAPDVWETLHGSRGSAVSLTQSIADAHKNSPSPLDAGQLAEQVQLHLPSNYRGFSLGDMGSIYKELRRQGRIGDGESPQTIARRLQDYAKPISAVRDGLGNNDIHAALDTFRQLPAEHFQNGSFDEIENRLRAGDILGRDGGVFQMTARAQGGLPPGVDLAQLAQKDTLLRQRAAGSSAGNLVAATQRLSQQIGVAEGTPAAQMLAGMQAGQLNNIAPRQWLEAMQASGINPVIARDAMSSSASNAKYLTPELVDTVRRNQMQLSIQPRVDQALSQHPPEAREQLRPSIQEQVAQRGGYQGWDQLQALQGPAAQGTRDMFALGRQRAPAGSPDKRDRDAGAGHPHALEKILSRDG